MIEQITTEKININEINLEQLISTSENFQRLYLEVSKIIVGQNQACQFMLLAILCNGHILLEGVPGVAKTTMIKAITKALGISFKRIQFTPDLLPADLIGTLVYNPKTQEFDTKKGPIFTNLILADEINRAPAKVQAALLEAMQEHQVTIGSTTHQLDEPFLVFATQNPLEQEGTYRLPEAQVDRFMFKLIINYPNPLQEREILTKSHDLSNIMQVCTKKDIFDAQKIVDQIYVDEKIVNYIVDIIFATRAPENYKLKDIKKFIQYGVSPRATLALYKAAKGYAFLKKRSFVIPDDVKFVCKSILRHRLILTYEADAENINTDDIIQKILETISCP